MRIPHVTIQSAKFEESIEFYKTYCGLTVQRELHLPGKEIVFLGNSPEETYVEIIDNKEAPYEGSGIAIGFVVSDVKAYHKELTEKGLNPTAIMNTFFFVKDPNGVSVQFIEK